MDGFPATGLPPSRPNARAPRLPARYSDAADEEAPTQQPNRKVRVPGSAGKTAHEAEA